MRCLDCNALRYLDIATANRAAKPHCIKCGGPLEEIDVSRKRWDLPTKTQLASELEKRKERKKENKIRCLGCGITFSEPSASIGKDLSEYLAVHLQGNEKCCDAYVEEDEIVKVVNLSLAIIPTLYTEKQGYNQVGVVGISPSGDRRIFGCYPTHAEAQEFLEELIGG
jgi:hypothetical protein